MSDKQYTIDAYILDALMRDLVGHDHRASAFLIYLALMAPCQEGAPSLSHTQLAERTGLSRRSAQDAVVHLVSRHLLRVTKRGVTDIPRYEPLTPWRRRRATSSEAVA